MEEGGSVCTHPTISQPMPVVLLYDRSFQHILMVGFFVTFQDCSQNCILIRSRELLFDAERQSSIGFELMTSHSHST